MLEPVQQAGQWVLKKAQSIPAARGDQNDFLPDSSLSTLGLDASQNQTPPPQADYFARQADTLQPQESQALEKGFRGVNISPLKTLETELKIRLEQTPIFQKLAEKNPFKKLEATSKPNAPHWTQPEAQEPWRHKITQKPGWKKWQSTKPAPLLPRETVLRGFPLAYRNLNTVPHLTISPQEIAFSVQEVKAQRAVQMVYDTPWNDESLFFPFKE